MDAIAIIYSDVPFSPFQRGYANLDVTGSSPNTLYHNVSFLFLPSSGFAFLLICLLCSPLIAVTPNVSIREYLRLGPVRLPLERASARTPQRLLRAPARHGRTRADGGGRSQEAQRVI